MSLLALNCGSSSVKFGVFDGPGRGELRRLAGGLVERIGGEARVAFAQAGTAAVGGRAAVADHEAAVGRVVAWLADLGLRPAAVGHRLVHGGARFTAPVVVDDAVAADLAAAAALAPLHNGPGLRGIAAARRALPDVPMVTVFDTAFHAELPDRAARYAIPWDLSVRHDVRRYGFHGIAYRSVLEAYTRLAGRPAGETRLVALHLGSGASVTAIDRGRSIDTSMGLTPLEGLVMRTRSGDVDPALVAYLAEREGVPAAEVVAWLNERSGLLGVSGTSGDVRDLLDRRRDDGRARLAIEMFCYRARKYLGAYLAALGGADAVLFSGGVGEHQPEIRAGIAGGLEWCGLGLDARANAATVGRAGRISAAGAAIEAWVIPADEERVIAAETAACLAAVPAGARG